MGLHLYLRFRFGDKRNRFSFSATHGEMDLRLLNPMLTKSGKLKTGVIFYRRDKEKGIINFVWKSVLTGLKSQMGFNSEEQKAMKKKVKNKDEKKK
ncbi:MAG: hypothetical protein PHP04_08185 [Bacteroidales bacterium]|nr:hypothetical protein [Bacteroidales bacterium]HNW73180.1 hypothetical protein [Bacteroidales bacterium]HPS51341.1 hypothetical protein [Bacteroidales bacterium]